MANLVEDKITYVTPVERRKDRVHQHILNDDYVTLCGIDMVGTSRTYSNQKSEDPICRNCDRLHEIANRKSA